MICPQQGHDSTQPFARDERISQPDLPTPLPFAAMPDGPNPIERMLAQGGETWVAFYEGNMVVPPGMIRRLMANDFEAVRARFQGFTQNIGYSQNIVQYLGPVQMPCLVFVGEDEPAYGGAKQLAYLLPHAEFVVYPGLNHFDMFTRIDVILPNILRFLDNNAYAFYSHCKPAWLCECPTVLHLCRTGIGQTASGYLDIPGQVAHRAPTKPSRSLFVPRHTSKV